MFLALGPLIETMIQWRPLTAVYDYDLVSTIWYCLNFQQGLNRDEKPRPKLTSTMDVKGKAKI